MTHKSTLAATFGLGTAINFPWEMAHSLLYRGVAGFTWREHLLCCGLASLIDGAGIAAIYVLGAVISADGYWTYRASMLKVAFVALLGLASATLAEVLALRLGWWAYGPSMPRLPGTNIGISPLAQFIVLPLAVLFGLLPRLKRCSRS